MKRLDGWSSATGIALSLALTAWSLFVSVMVPACTSLYVRVVAIFLGLIGIVLISVVVCRLVIYQSKAEPEDEVIPDGLDRQC